MLAPGVDQELKDWVAVKYFRAVCRQILSFGVLHTDPQPANYFVTHHPKLGILDFGSIRVFPDSLRRSYLRLARGLLEDDRREMIAACRALDYLGRGDRHEAMVEILQTLARAAPGGSGVRFRALPLARQGDRGRGRGGREGTLSRTRAPVFLVRALVGLEAYVKQLGTVTNWRRIFAKEVRAAVQGNRSFG